MKDSTVIYSLALLSLCIMATIAYMGRAQFIEGRNDFVPLYTGPLLLNTGELYDNASLLAKEQATTGMSHTAHGYIRPPFVAALMWPLSRLSYDSALRVWQVASLISIAAFALFWTQPSRPYTVFFTCMSIPALLAWSNGQDTPFLLLVIAVTARLHLRGKPFHAGLLFALCAAKGHLFLLTPIWILARQDWAFLRGLSVGGLALAALSTLVAGWHWPAEMLAAVSNPMFSPNTDLMTNLHAAFLNMPLGGTAELIFSLAVVAAAWIGARKSGFLQTFGAALIGGILLARHSYPYDLLLVLPGCLALIALSTMLILRVLAVALLLPPVALAIHFSATGSLLYTLALFTLMAGWAWETPTTVTHEVQP